MKRIKQITVIFLLTLLFLCAFPIAAFAGTNLGSGTVRGNVLWSVDKISETETVLTISGNGYMEDYGTQVDQPWSKLENQITSIIVKPGVMSVGSYAFAYLENATSVTLPINSLKKIGNNAFFYCKSIRSLTIPSTVTEIGTSAFYNCYSLATLNIPNGVKKIENATCYGCDLKSIVIPNGVTEVGVNAFAKCTGLTSVSIPSSVTIFGQDAFKDTPWLKSLGDLAIVNGSLLAYQGANENVVIPDGVKRISDDAFYYNKQLKKVTIPESVTDIGTGIFCGCSNLEEVTIPSKVTCLRISTFERCTSLKEVTIPAGVTAIEEHVFFKCDALTDVYYGGSKSMWDKITIGINNSCLTDATIHYALSESETVEVKKARANADSLINKAREVTAGVGYPSSAVTMVKNAKDALDKVLSDKNATEKQIKDAAEKLEEAIQFAYNQKEAIRRIEDDAKTAAIQIANPLKVTVKKLTLKYKTLKKKKLILKKAKAFTIKNAQGKVTFKKISGNKKITINKKTGRITVKKGLKKGTYRLKVKVIAAGNSKYKAGSKTITLKIKVK